MASAKQQPPLYIVVADDRQRTSFPCTRPIPQSALQIMGCKPATPSRNYCQCTKSYSEIVNIVGRLLLSLFYIWLFGLTLKLLDVMWTQGQNREEAEQERSQKNTDNRKKQKTKHKIGLKSYLQVSFEKRNLELTHTNDGTRSNTES
ncbi:uncharacterized protein [Triticum aestivum]|uniref:uncharacterized protein isoform X2 n=1 Tax=Triticum aestivum TaxID=4565 RepID=UPI001D0194B8|nr:uncharacterized protein LOC123105475 isoform X2 [Triticum aestivum]